MPFACQICSHPAVTLPDELRDDAVVSCQGCGAAIGSWAAFKQQTTRAILAEIAEAGSPGMVFGSDPLDLALLAGAASSRHRQGRSSQGRHNSAISVPSCKAWTHRVPVPVR